MGARVQTGLERLLSGQADFDLRGRRVGLVANPTTVDGHLVHAADRLSKSCELVALFGPEHGIRGDAQYMVSVDQASDRATGVPVYSLYGSVESSLTPTPESLTGLDVMIFDIQDVGARYYTYVWTMVLAMRACAKAGIEFVVLDRPNPIGGERVEGGWIAEGYHSFVGLRSLPNRHGLTAGEIASWAHAEEKMDLQLHVIEMRGWERAMLYPETGLPWVQPSPNMPTVDTALVYPGMCLLEGTEISEGRGTTRPFEVAGAPYVDAQALTELLHEQQLPGVRFRPTHFVPTFDKSTGESCAGVQQHVTDANSYLPYRSAVAFVWAMHRLWPEHFAWRTKAYEFVDTIPAFDLLAGSSALRTGIESGASIDELAATWVAGEAEFREMRKAWLRYS